MTNHWADIANSTCVIAWGANPVENHPACVAHINRARFPKDYFPATSNRALNKTPARLIVIDPRKTRTALQVNEAKGDRYIRIRPGTDIALQNGILRYILEKMETAGAKYADNSNIPATIQSAFFNFLNENSSYGNYRVDAGNAQRTIDKHSKYTDARFEVAATNDDYVRATNTTDFLGTTGQSPISNIPVKLNDCRASANGGNVNTVYERLKAHVQPYLPSVVAGICDCSADDVAYIADEMIRNSRHASSPDGSLVLGGTMGGPNHPESAAFRATTILYAMGITQHTYGSQNIKGFANLQILMGNMGRAGGGINALRGIHNVQGSTDMGLLYGNIPAYSGNPTTQPECDPNAFGKY